MKRLFILLTVLALVAVPQLTAASDLDDLKAVDEQGEKLAYSMDPKDIDAYVSMIDDGIIYFDANIPFPIRVTREMAKKMRTEELAQMEYIYWIPGNKIYSVVGTTGIVNGYGTAISKLKGGTEIISNIRVTIVYAKTDGKWRVCAAHVSKMPLGN